MSLFKKINALKKQINPQSLVIHPNRLSLHISKHDVTFVMQISYLMIQFIFVLGHLPLMSDKEFNHFITILGHSEFARKFCRQNILRAY